MAVTGSGGNCILLDWPIPVLLHTQNFIYNANGLSVNAFLFALLAGNASFLGIILIMVVYVVHNN